MVDEGVLEMKRGRGMFVVEGAQDKLQHEERNKFISEELPALLGRIQDLDISVNELVGLLKSENN